MPMSVPSTRARPKADGFRGEAAGSGEFPDADRFLGIYLNDHLAGSTAGVRLARRLARRHAATAFGGDLASICREIEEDRAALRAVLARLGVSERRHKIVGGWLAELLGRAKANGRVLSRSPLSTVIEVEALRLGVEGKRLAWSTLSTAARHDAELGLEAAEFDALADRAADQAARLEEMRTRAVREALSRVEKSEILPAR
jgi:hypothetical protein